MSHSTTRGQSQYCPTPNETPKRRVRHGGRKSIALAFTLVLAVALTGCGSRAKGAAADSSVGNATLRSALGKEGTIQIVDNTYSNGPIEAQLIAQSINAFGGHAEVKSITDIGATFGIMAKADNMFSPEVLRGLYEAQFEQYVDKEKSVVELGDGVLPADEGWYVPTYMIKGDAKRGIKPSCPGLPDWKALNACASVFATAQSGSQGQYTAGAAAWAPYYGDPQRIKNLGLNYKMVFTGSEAALDAEWTRAYEAGKPIVGLMWTPTYIALKYDLTKIQFPPYFKGCWDKGGSFACNWPPQDSKELASAAFPSKYPAATSVIKKYTVTSDQMKDIMSMVQDKGMTPAAAVTQWMKDNPSVWHAWA